MSLTPYKPLIPVSIIAVLNVTPDSFSDGGSYFSPEKAYAHAVKLREEGADFVELGAESTGPGSRPISVEEEWKRLEPVIKKIADIPYGIDTYKSEIARRALSRGARLINDVSCGSADPELARVVADSPAFLVLMHSKERGSSPHVTDSVKEYEDVVQEVSRALLTAANSAIRSGVHSQKIVLDPGMGRFLSHEPHYSFELLRRYEELVAAVAPFPVMVATSRKGFLGGSLDERDPLSQFTATIAVHKGARFVRTHKPRMMRQFLDISDKIVKG